MVGRPPGDDDSAGKGRLEQLPDSRLQLTATVDETRQPVGLLGHLSRHVGP